MVDNFVPLTLTLTIVQFDLVDSTRFWDGIRKMGLGPETVRLVVEKIEQTIRNAFDEAVNGLEINSELTRIYNFEADGGKCTFESLEIAYKFVEIFCTFVDRYNQNPNIDKWRFRISAATGEISYDESKLNKMVGDIFVEAKVLEAGAYPGWLFVDQVTYNYLSQDIKDQRDFSQENFKTKHGEPKQAWGCRMLLNASERPQETKITLKSTGYENKKLREAIKKCFDKGRLERLLKDNYEKLKIENLDNLPFIDNAYESKIQALIDRLKQDDLINEFLIAANEENAIFGKCIEYINKKT